MKPKILCGECQLPLVWGDRFCSSCGKPVEWPTQMATTGLQGATVRCQQCGAENDAANETCKSCGVTLGTAKSRKEKSPQPEQPRTARKKALDQSVAASWKMVAGFVVFLAIGVLTLELLTVKKIATVPKKPVQENTSTANMQALQQIDAMEKRLAANPNDDELQLQLANVLNDNRFYDKAIQRYSEYLQKHPKDADARVDLGICYYETDRTDEAKREMMKALESNPKHILSHFNLGIVNLRIAQTAMNAGNTEQANKAIQEANEWFRKTVVLDPNGSAGQRAQRLLAEHGNQTNLPTN